MNINGSAMRKPISTIPESLDERSSIMKNHPVFTMINSIEDLQTFMQWHVFAVWDFMSLVKRLQHEYTTLRLPWCPPKHAQATRLINEIVLGEESDITLGDGHSSHFDLYLAAMEEIGTSTDRIRQFVELVDGNMSVDDALRLIEAPQAIADFVRLTLDVAINGRTEEVLGSFLYGREDAIPEMFRSLLNSWHLDESNAPMFVFYLQRHIELDTDSHGPAAKRLIEAEVQERADALERLHTTAIAAVEQRIRLWDALAAHISQRSK